MSDPYRDIEQPLDDNEEDIGDKSTRLVIVQLLFCMLMTELVGGGSQRKLYLLL